MKFYFEDQVLDLDRRELTRGGEVIGVEPQVFDLLVYLVRNADRVMTRDDLISGVWQGRIVSDSTLSSRIAAVRDALNDSGEQQRLVRTFVRKGFRFVGEVRQDHPGSEKNAAASVHDRAAGMARSPLEIPDRPSIAVLPFQNMSGDPEQEYFADGMVEEIITGLSRVGWLFVIARNSSFVYKGQPVDIRRVGLELGVRYVLEGSVRKAAGKVRIAGQLIDATTGAHLWADRFEGELDDVFELQDQVTSRVVGAIAPKVQQAEIERARRKKTEALDAYDLLLRGMAHVHQATAAANAGALALFGRATEIDPEFATAYGMAAYCYIWRKSSGWMDDQKQEIAEAARFAYRAVELAKDDPVALARGGQALAYVVGELDAGAAAIDQALELCPSLALAWYASGWVRIYLGEADLGIDHLLRAQRLSPVDPEISRVQAGIATAHLVQGRHRDALEWAQRALRGQPAYPTALRLAAAGNALIGAPQAARQLIETLRRVDPGLRVSRLGERLPFRRGADLARYQEGLRKAGLPE